MLDAIFGTSGQGIWLFMLAILVVGVLAFLLKKLWVRLTCPVRRARVQVLSIEDKNNHLAGASPVFLEPAALIRGNGPHHGGGSWILFALYWIVANAKFS